MKINDLIKKLENCKTKSGEWVITPSDKLLNETLKYLKQISYPMINVEETDEVPF